MEAELYFLSVDGTYLVFDVSTLLLVRKYLVIGSTPFVSVFTRSNMGGPSIIFSIVGVITFVCIMIFSRRVVQLCVILLVESAKV